MSECSGRGDRGVSIRGGQGGFTFLELALIILLLAIMAITAYISITPSGTQIDAVSKVLRSNLQLAQDLAMTHGSDYGFEGTSTTEYRIFEGAPGSPARDPLTNQDFVVGISPVSFVGTVPTITFEASGRPDITSDAIINLSDGINTRQVTVARSTGYVSIGP